jgi:hypothetical protein
VVLPNPRRSECRMSQSGDYFIACDRRAVRSQADCRILRPASSREWCDRRLAPPEALRLRNRIDLVLLPPALLIALIVQGAVVQAAERHREGVAGLEAEAARF